MILAKQAKKNKGYQLDNTCPFCGGDVVFASNKEIYGREYGNGKCYLCRDCKASVGTHNDGSPLGRLSNREMKELKKKAHAMFDPIWRVQKELKRGDLYGRLANKMSISKNDCHFGHFGVEELHQAIAILQQTDWYKEENKGE